jgi:hypothetical protein
MEFRTSLEQFLSKQQRATFLVSRYDDNKRFRAQMICRKFFFFFSRLQFFESQKEVEMLLLLTSLRLVTMAVQSLHHLSLLLGSSQWDEFVRLRSLTIALNNKSLQYSNHTKLSQLSNLELANRSRRSQRQD